MNYALVATLAVPVITGITSAVWAPIAKHTVVGMSLLNFVAYGLVWAFASLTMPADPGLSGAVRALGWWPCVAYVGLSAAVSVAWFVAHADTHVVWIAVGEAAWPLWAGLGTLALAAVTRLPVTPPQIGPLDALWGAFILAGVLGIAFTK